MALTQDVERAGLESWLCAHVASVSGIPIEGVGLDEGLENFAVDSESMIEIIMGLEEKAGLTVELDADVVFGTGTLRGLIDYVLVLRQREVASQ